MHLTVLKYSTNELGYVQCVIRAKDKDEFLAMGFVDHIDKVKKPRSRRKAADNGN